ncbi:hypothetical protein ABK040_007769 [Willaertia magna]
MEISPYCSVYDIRQKYKCTNFGQLINFTNIDPILRDVLLTVLDNTNNKIKIETDYEHIIQVLNQLNLTMITFGNNQFCQCGHCKINNDFTILTIPKELQNIKLISTGLHFTNYHFGNQSFCCSGLWSEYHSSLFQIPNVYIPLKNIFTTMYSTIFQSEDNLHLYCWGSNQFGQMPIPIFKDGVILPKLINTNLYNNQLIRSVKNTATSTYILTENNYLFVCGNNNDHQLGIEWLSNNNDDDNNLQNEEELIKEKKLIVQMEQVNYLSNESQFISITAGDAHAILLNEDGELFMTGSNQSGQLGIQDTEYLTKFTKVNILKDQLKENEKIIFVHCCSNSTILITNFDKIYVFGDNSNGELGIDENIKFTYVPILNTYLSNQNIINIMGESSFFGISKIDNEINNIFCWGNNEEGQLGIPFIINNNSGDGSNSNPNLVSYTPSNSFYKNFDLTKTICCCNNGCTECSCSMDGATSSNTICLNGDGCNCNLGGINNNNQTSSVRGVGTLKSNNENIVMNNVYIPQRNYLLENIRRLAFERGYEMKLSVGFDHTIIYFKLISKQLQSFFELMRESIVKDNWLTDITIVASLNQQQISTACCKRNCCFSKSNNIETKRKKMN